MTTNPDPFDGTLFDPSAFTSPSPAPKRGRSVRSSQFPPTQEQQAILDAVADGKTTAISAGAGTGKTSTLRMIAEARPEAKMLYIAYNKAIQVEAANSFPKNVTAKTAHALAYRKFGVPMRARLFGRRIRLGETAEILGIDSDLILGKGADGKARVLSPVQQVKLVMQAVDRFCHSADPEITVRHLQPPVGLTLAETAIIEDHLLPFVMKAWADLTSGPYGQCRPTHDVYLKQWQLAKPDLTGFDAILYDEAQDADPVIADVVERQHHLQIIAVGDENQAIYGWRGAGSFLQQVNAAHRLRLTQSWRFGDAIAREANTWLGVIGTDMRLTGDPQRQSKLESLVDPDAVLCRSNAGTIMELLDAHAAGKRVHLVGDGTRMNELAHAAQRLMDGEPSGSLELAAFTSWSEVVEYVENDPGGADLAIEVHLIQRYGPPAIIDAIKGTVSQREAELVVSTAHKGKGLEWGRARIANDFTEPIDTMTGEPLPISDSEAMLAYVAVTRAKNTLDADGLAWVHDHMARLRSHKEEDADWTSWLRRYRGETPST